MGRPLMNRAYWLLPVRHRALRSESAFDLSHRVDLCLYMEMGDDDIRRGYIFSVYLLQLMSYP